MEAPGRPQIIRFGVFEVDLRAEELRKNGSKIKLRRQPFQVLVTLLERPGEVVTREELQQRLWPDGTFVDFDHSLNTAINKIREVLGDSAENPRFVETLARRGYRFIAAVENAGHDVQIEMLNRRSRLAVGVVERSVAGKEPSSRERWSGRLIWLAALLLLAIGGVAWFYLSRLRSSSLMLPPMKVIRLTSFPGEETQPAFSPDGKMVAFVWEGEKGDNHDIYVMLVDAGNPLRLTTDPGDDLSPAWSPDGRFVAFRRNAKEKSGIYLVPALGGPERKLTSADPDDSLPRSLDWSPDGKYLAVSAGNSGLRHSLFLFSVGAGERRQLTHPSAGPGDFSPAFSPDSQTVAFSRVTGGGHVDIYSTPIQGGGTKRLTFDDRSTRAAWASDGSEIIFSRFPLGGLYRISVSGGVATPLLEGGQFGSLPSISREGNRLVYSEQSYEGSDIWRIDLPRPGSKAVSATRLISSSQEEDLPYFSPDGKKIVFASSRSGTPQIWTCDSDGRHPLQLTSFAGPSMTGTPRWSPDGKLIAFDSRQNGPSDIFVISPESDSPRRLTKDPTEDYVPSWSRDSRWIYFCSDRGGKGNLQIWKMPAGGGPATQVTQNGGFEAFESFDRKLLFYSKWQADEIWRIPIAGGPESLFLTGVEQRYWAVAEGGIYFVAVKGSESFLKFIDFATLRVTKIMRLERKLVKSLSRGLALSPNGRSLLCTLEERYSSDLMLVENFR